MVARTYDDVDERGWDVGVVRDDDGAVTLLSVHVVHTEPVNVEDGHLTRQLQRDALLSVESQRFQAAQQYINY